MNGFFIFNLTMLVICLINFVIVSRNDYAPLWVKILVFLMIIMVAIITALSYGSGPLSQ